MMKEQDSRLDSNSPKLLHQQKAHLHKSCLSNKIWYVKMSL